MSEKLIAKIRKMFDGKDKTKTIWHHIHYHPMLNADDKAMLINELKAARGGLK